MGKDVDRSAAEKQESGPLHLAGLVDYQPASVVSRTLYERKGATATVFAFDEGQGLSEHTTPFDALVYVVEGEAEITVSGARHQVGQGALIVMPANEPHAVRAKARFKMLLVLVRS